MTLSEELVWRGFLNQTTLKDITDLDKKTRTFYMGFDASADSQAVGNLAAMMFIWTFIRHGYDPIILTGGSTSLIGDPKDTEERSLQSEETIAHNTECARKQIQKIFDGIKFRMVNNLDWTRDVKVLDFLRNIGKNYSMTNLVQRDFIASRMGEGGGGISFAEFSYTLLQGYDYQYLYDTYGCTLQLGGSDQWGNCLSGVELIRKTRGVEVDVVTLNLVIDKTTGRKFGKSEAGAVWLDANKTSPFMFYQFWLNVGDADAVDYLKIFTTLDKSQVDELAEQMKSQASSRPAQKRLAYEVTKIVHSEAVAKSVQRITEILYGSGDYKSLSPDDFEQLKNGINYGEGNFQPLVDILVTNGLAKSKTEARQYLESNAIYINGQQIPLSKTHIDSGDIINGYAIIRRGKNQQLLYKLTNK